MNKYLFLIMIILYSCNSDKSKTDSNLEVIYPNTVGDIEFNEKTDNPNFQLCREYQYSPQYYWLGFEYEGEMWSIKENLKKSYKSKGIEGQTGFITIRFIVNCKGKSGRFRLYSTDQKLEEFTFTKEISDQLLKIVKELSGWKAGEIPSGENIDYYQYLTFKIVNGQIKEITP